jgi:hypothetical protein
MTTIITARGVALTALALLAACSDSPLAPAPSGSELAAQNVPVTRLEERAATGPTRIEVSLLPGGLVAREVEIQSDATLSDEEDIKSHIAGIDAKGAVATVTLRLGALRIGFDPATRLRMDGRDDLTFHEFVALVEGALADGRELAVEAKRRPAAEPQAPEDATFFATVLRIRDKVDEPKIEINVDGDNVIPNDAPPPDAFLAILGIRIELRVSGGVTEIQEDGDDVPGQPADEFEGSVQSVDVTAGTFTLSGGTVVRLADDTVIEQDGDLFSLAAAADAVAQGRPVRAEGRGTVEGNDPLTFVAQTVKFEVDD